MKRAFVLSLITLITLAPWLVIGVYAANAPDFSLAPNLTAEPGETITVPITVSNNPGFTTVGLVVTYDPAVLQIANVTAPEAAMPLSPQFLLATGQDTQWIRLVNPQTQDWSGDGVVANVTFNVSPTANPSTSNISLTFTSSPDGSPGNAVGAVFQDARVVSGSVIIVDSASGNGDVPTDSANTSTGMGQPIVAGNVNQNVSEPVAPPTVGDAISGALPPPVVIAEAEPPGVGVFIGVPHVRDEVGIPIVGVSVFGPVPQTGVQGLAGYVIAMIACLIGSFMLWAWLIRPMYKDRKNGKQISD